MDMSYVLEVNNTVILDTRITGKLKKNIAPNQVTVKT